MCISPITVFNKAVYSHPAVTSSYVEVPCNNCEACRDARKTSWEDRLCLEVSDWYKAGGIGLMLTFTYNDRFLPVFNRDGLSMPCFRWSDVLGFLNRLKTRSSRLFGNDFYRYFVCSEFGKDTHRPHYHTIFLIRDASKYKEFVELCRELWSTSYKRDKKGHQTISRSLGFVFPKLHSNGLYLDERGNNKDPRFRSQLAGAKYVCKYICKDLAYCSHPNYKYFLDNYPEFRDVMPKSWKSNNLGFSHVMRLVNGASDKDIEKLLDLGVWSPLQQKFVPLWDSAVNRLMYRNVFNGRISRKTDNKLYDRELTTFGRKYLFHAFKLRVIRTTQKIYERMLLVSKDPFISQMFHFSLPTLFIRSQFKRAALYHCLLSSLNELQLSNMFDKFGCSVERFFDVDSWRTFYDLRHDSVTLSSCDLPYPTTCHSLKFLEPYAIFEKSYKALSIYLQKCNLEKYRQRGESITRAKKVCGVYTYPLNLC